MSWPPAMPARTGGSTGTAGLARWSAVGAPRGRGDSTRSYAGCPVSRAAKLALAVAPSEARRATRPRPHATTSLVWRTDHSYVSAASAWPGCGWRPATGPARSAVLESVPATSSHHVAAQLGRDPGRHVGRPRRPRSTEQDLVTARPPGWTPWNWTRHRRTRLAIEVLRPPGSGWSPIRAGMPSRWPASGCSAARSPSGTCARSGALLPDAGRLSDDAGERMALVDRANRFAPDVGERWLTSPRPLEASACPDCGAEPLAGDRFCEDCGTTCCRSPRGTPDSGRCGRCVLLRAASRDHPDGYCGQCGIRPAGRARPARAGPRPVRRRQRPGPPSPPQRGRHGAAGRRPAGVRASSPWCATASPHRMPDQASRRRRPTRAADVLPPLPRRSDAARHRDRGRGGRRPRRRSSRWLDRRRRRATRPPARRWPRWSPGET